MYFAFRFFTSNIFLSWMQLFNLSIFSDDISTIVFQTGSFIYNGNKYNANYEKVTSGLLSKTEVEEIRDSIFKEYRYSRLILENDWHISTGIFALFYKVTAFSNTDGCGLFL